MNLPHGLPTGTICSCSWFSGSLPPAIHPHLCSYLGARICTQKLPFKHPTAPPPSKFTCSSSPTAMFLNLHGTHPLPSHQPSPLLPSPLAPRPSLEFIIPHCTTGISVSSLWLCLPLSARLHHPASGSSCLPPSAHLHSTAELLQRQLCKQAHGCTLHS